MVQAEMLGKETTGSYKRRNIAVELNRGSTEKAEAWMPAHQKSIQTRRQEKLGAS